MKVIFLIIEREFLSRVKKKSFLLLTFLAPLLFAGVMVLYAWIMTSKDNEVQNIIVVDESGLINDKLDDSDIIKFTYMPTGSIDSLKQAYIDNKKAVTVLQIGPLVNNSINEVTFFSSNQINMSTQIQIENSIEKIVEEHKLKGYDIEGLADIMASIKTQIKAKTIRWDEQGKEQETSTPILMAISYIAAFLIYMFIFMFGSMVMRGVIEEKSNRIIEVIISSVRPFQLMIGKIIGVASVGLLQFILWVLLTLLFSTVIQSMFLGDMVNEQVANIPGSNEVTSQIQNEVLQNALTTLQSIPLVSILITFILFFLGGYLLYASMFAAIGSAVENETETQQLIMPITIPLVLGLILMTHTFQYPNSTISVWASIIPFTSPMVMMARVPFGVPFWQIALSLSILCATFLTFTWISAKIYRVGILMYGKKASFKELWKWMWYKD